MRAQFLDRLELERERGITIKMAPVRMIYRPQIKGSSIKNQSDNLKFKNNPPPATDSIFNFDSYVLNLIDTPGHSDFAYEVSRALQAVEGAILLVDVTKGIQAQTLSNFRAAKKAGLTIIGAVNKVDLQPERAEKEARSLAELLGVSPDEIHRVSCKTGEGIENLLRDVIRRVPPPSPAAVPSPGSADLEKGGRALIFDSLYDDHKGILAYVRAFDGEIRTGQELVFLAGGGKCRVKEVGYFAPEFRPGEKLKAGEIGYIATGLKEPALVKIGDTVVSGAASRAALPGYREPAPVVFISFYPDGATEFEDLKRAMERLRLTDAALSFEPDKNDALGRGLKVGFLGQLHFEITASRLEREFGLQFLTSFPSIAYKVKEKGEWLTVKDAHDFPDSPEAVLQPMIRVEILSPANFLNSVVNLKNVFDLEILEIKNMGENILLFGRMPLAELIRDFDDRLRSASAGYASFSYELEGYAPAEVLKLEILVAGEVVPALTRIVPKKDVEREGRMSVERLKELLPRQQFTQALQARVDGKIIAREDIPALRKDVTGYLYGGDRSRKMKLWKKQKRGKEKLASMAKVSIPAEAFREILKK